jgi:hypothetical protein
MADEQGTSRLLGEEAADEGRNVHDAELLRRALHSVLLCAQNANRATEEEGAE